LFEESFIMVTYDERPWLQHYDPHVPKSLEPYPDKVMTDYLRETVDSAPNRVALITTNKVPILGRLDKAITYRELDEKSDAMATALVELGLEKGDRVAIVMPNCVQFAIAYFAVLKAGGCVAATNPTYPKGKMTYQLNDSDANFVITLTLFYDLIKEVQPKTKVQKVIVSNIKDYFPTIAKTLFTLAMEKKMGHHVDALKTEDVWFLDLLTKYAGQKPNVDVTPDDLALFQYTGGTTGVSKGAIATHRILVATTEGVQVWTGLKDGAIAGLRKEDMIYLGAIPMFHAYGLVALLTNGISGGGKIVLIPNPRDIDEVVDIIHHYKTNVFLGVPALYNAVNNHHRIKSGEVSLGSFVLSTSGSAPLPSATQKQFEQLSQCRIVEGFGMSETPVATHSNPILGEKRFGSVGLPYPDVDCRIVSLDDGETILPVGDVGELVISGPNVMRGYHGMPTETANALREKDGKTWLHTGDIARMDEDGYFYLVDRKKDMALIGGFNVYPAEVENALKSHPEVFEVGVAAIPHPEKVGQEALKAWIVLQPESKITQDELITHCGDYLAQYAIPRRFTFVNELPKSAVGKTLRRELIRMEMDDQEAHN
jgi:long-chain acyl-CoA synthetase